MQTLEREKEGERGGIYTDLKLKGSKGQRKWNRKIERGIQGGKRKAGEKDRKRGTNRIVKRPRHETLKYREGKTAI